MLGVNLSGAEFGKNHRYGYDYIYPSEKDIAAYATRGAELIRLPFKWERMQTEPGGSLNQAELGRLKAFLEAAERQGVKVVLDLHNYGRYGDKVLGTAELPQQVFADFWGKLAAQVGSYKAIYGYGLMNEPHGFASDEVWPAAAQAAVNAIRVVDATHTIIVGGDAWSSAKMWTSANKKLDIKDPQDKILYEAHVYFDNDGSGVYDASYDKEHAYPTIGADRIRNFVDWLDEHDARGFIGEFAVPDTDPRWLTVLDNFLATVESAGLDATYWGAGPWFGNYKLGLLKKDGTERPQLDVLEKYLGAAHGEAIEGSARGETLEGGRGDDIIYAREGDDIVLSSLGADRIDGGLGSDTVSYRYDLDAVDVDLRRDAQLGGNAAGDRLSGVENLIGTRGADRLAGDEGANVLQGLAGDDRLEGGRGADTLDGGNGVDTVSYADSAAGVSIDLGKMIQAGGSAEGDRLIAIENVIGSPFADRLAGDAGSNKLWGGAGDDVFLESTGGTDVLDGGSGHDVYDASTSTRTIKVDLAAGGNNWLRMTSIEEVRGGSTGDELRGDDGANRLVGNAGNDLLDGAGGADVIDGGAGKDKLVGGAGADWLIGGLDADRFVFSDADLRSGQDTIADFSRLQGDFIDLGRIDADAGRAGDQHFTFVGDSKFSGQAGELRVVSVDGGVHVQGDVDGDGLADFSLMVQGIASLAATDLIL